MENGIFFAFIFIIIMLAAWTTNGGWDDFKKDALKGTPEGKHLQTQNSAAVASPKVYKQTIIVR